MLLANGFRPDPRVHREARTLTEQGWQVTLLCLDRDCDLPPDQTVDGIRVVRIRAGRVAPGEARSLGPALARFYRDALRWVGRFQPTGSIGVIHCHDLDTVVPALLLRRRLGAPVVYDTHDLYSSFFHRAWLERLVQRFDRAAYGQVDAQIVVNDGFLAVDGVDADKTVVVMNVPARGGAEACADRSAGLFYAGNLEARRDMRYALPVIAAAGLTACFAGDGPLLDAHRALAPAGVEFLGRIPHADVVEQTRRCLAVLVLYDTRFRNNRLATPNKLFDAMKFGKPAIVSAGSIAAEIVREHDCGLAVRYGDPDSFAAALRTLQDDARYAQLARNAYRAFHEHYHWELMQQRLLDLYERLLVQRRSSHGIG
jgi:glycosyltransferase involved in cell wall biosynthesis